MKKIIFAVTIIILISPFFLIDSHHINIPYLLWKNGLTYDYKKRFKYLNVDSVFVNSLIGKSKKHLIKYYPNSYSINESKDYQKFYVPTFKTKDAIWLGETYWAAEIKNEVVIEICLLKG